MATVVGYWATLVGYTATLMGYWATLVGYTATLMGYWATLVASFNVYQERVSCF